MNQRVLRRFIILLAILTVGSFIFWDVLEEFVKREPGDYYTEVGSNRLNDQLYDEAMVNFDKALEKAPNHRGALMGRALVFIQAGKYVEAIAELDYLIEFLNQNLEEGDATGRAVLAGAYANRGIVYDRQGDYKKALESYIEGLKVDEEAVSGPGVINKILYGLQKPSSVRERARYIYEQLQLPEDQRILSIPGIDAQQRMFKP